MAFQVGTVPARIADGLFDDCHRLFEVRPIGVGAPRRLPDFYAAIGDTLLMVVWSGAISFVLGLILGVLLTVTKPGGILENRAAYQILDKLASLFRSIPFIILLTWVMPVSRAIMGTAISLLDLTAMAGVVGAGGLGDFAIRYGHDRNMLDVTNVTVLVLVVLVCLIEFVGGRVVRKNTH